MIHPTAVIHPRAQLDPSVEIGPMAVIDEHVIVGPRCRIGPFVYLTGHTTFGADNVIHAGAVLGDAPQDFKYRGEPTRLRFGDRNVIREQATVHRSNKVESETVVGSDNLLMAHCHVGHDVVVGDRVILCNGSAIAGHAVIGDRVFISANALVHQFCRVGTLALMQGGSAISVDLPPFCIARGGNGIAGLNVVGLRRAGFSAADRLELKQVYHALFRARTLFRQALEDASSRFHSPAARTMIDFTASTKRGLCRDLSMRSRAANDTDEMG